MVGHSVVWALTLSVLLWIAFPTSIAREAPGADCFRIACCFRSANNTATTTVNLWNYEDSTVGASGNCNDVSFEKNYRARVHPIGATNYICSSTASAQYLVRGTLADNGKSKHRAFRSSSFVFHVSGLKKVSKDASMPAGNNSGSYCLLQFLTGDISTVSAIEFQPLHPISSNMIKPSATSRKLMQALSNQDRSRFFLTIVVGCFMGISVLLLVLVVVVTTVCANKRQKKDSVVEAEESLKLPPKYIAKPVPEPELELKHMDKIQKFSLLELNVATNSFNNRIGEGGFGAVYHGILPDGQAIAVKVRSANSIQGLREFTTELTFLSDIRHDNLVPLIGVCTEQQILVYPYMSNGSLQDRLYGEAARRKPLDWITRLNIALGAARGLQFLHCTAGARCIIHRDVKSSNILLDNSMVAKVADFGFSKYAPQEGDSMVSLEVRGTAGYMDPEYYFTQQLTVKSDVFSFGVVLLEIICGREPLNIHRPRPEWSLVEWAKPFIVESNIQAIVDPAISSSYTPEAMWRVVEVALASVESHGVHRPTMEGIIRELEDALIIETNASAYMASLDSTGSFRLSLSDSKMPPPMPLFYQFDPSPVFSETMGSPDPR